MIPFRYIRRTAVCVAALLATSCSSSFKQIRTPMSAPAASDEELANAIFRKVNDYRRSMGKHPLEPHDGLATLSWQQAESMRTRRTPGQPLKISHLNFEQRAAMARYHYNVQWMAENVAAGMSSGDATADMLLELWKNSRSHRHNLLSSWEYTGVGVATDEDGVVFASEMFGTGGGRQKTMLERTRQH